MRSRNLRIWLTSVWMCIKESLAFRSQFFLLFLSFIISNMVFPLLFYSVYLAGFSYPGWTLKQVLFFYGTYLLITGIPFTFFEQALYLFQRQIMRGEFDYILVRGVSPLLLVLSRAFFLEGSGDLITGSVLLGLFWTKGNTMAYIAAIFIAEIFLLAVVIFMLSLALKITSIRHLSSLYWFLFQAMKHPLEVYPFILRFVFVFVVPLAIVSWIPARVFFGLSPIYLVVPAVVSTALFLGALIAWQRALRIYTSAGG